jgi:hypothetical protein
MRVAISLQNYKNHAYWGETNFVLKIMYLSIDMDRWQVKLDFENARPTTHNKN